MISAEPSSQTQEGTVNAEVFLSSGMAIDGGQPTRAEGKSHGDGPGERPATTARVSILDEQGATKDATTSGFS